MPDRFKSPLYQEDLAYCANLPIHWDKLTGRTIAISGATGMIGTFLIDVLMKKNEDPHFDCRIIAIERNKSRAQNRFPYFDESHFSFVQMDVSEPGAHPSYPSDIVIHLASTTHPRAYAAEPVSTITSNVIGLQNLLEYSRESQLGQRGRRFIFASSVEIYGQNRGDTERFDEKYCGYIDSNTLRAGYPEAKRLGESLCRAYFEQYGIDFVIPRIARSYGPTLHKDDSKALSQFIHKGLSKEDIVLKSKGEQLFSYAYVADTVAGLLYCLLEGETGEAYNIAAPASDYRLKDLASLIASQCGVGLRYELPDSLETKGYSTASIALMDGRKLQSLGWNMRYSIREGIERTLSIMRDA